MAKVYDLAVKNLTDAALKIVKMKPEFLRTDFANFERLVTVYDRRTYGLPLHVYHRAVEEAYKNIEAIAAQQWRTTAGVPDGHGQGSSAGPDQPADRGDDRAG